MRLRNPLILVAFCLAASCAFAGPPFLTDDPEPVEYHGYELHLYSTVDRSPEGYGVALPAFELNIGPLPNLQLHVGGPMTLAVPREGVSHYGAGDFEISAKYRFIQEKGWRPQISFYPALDLPSGNSHYGLGNGQSWGKFPFWAQKSWGAWTTYGGAGYLLNPAPGMRSHAFGGWLLQRDINKRLTLGGEWYTPGSDTAEQHSPQILNAGGYFSMTPHCALLFSAGHSVHGDSHTVAYLGLRWTWGASSGDAEKNAANGALHPGYASLHGI